MRKTIILHGYSDRGASFQELATFLSKNGIQAVTVFVGDYITLEDTVTVPDLASAFARALADKGISDGPGEINLIVHSTGSLVAREWMTRFYLERGRPCPVRHYLMLAPANFGSPLAAKGKTMLGRIIKGWKTGFESGLQVLNALEMASPYTWSLARRDLFGETSFYRPDQCLAAVLVGTKPYGTGLRQLADENGGDGTVYVCTANLNATGLTAEFHGKDEDTKVDFWKRAADPIAFGVFADRDHSSITRPEEGNPDLKAMILDFLRVQDATDYAAYRAQCETHTRSALPDIPHKDIFHRYQNLVSRVTDSLGFPVRDYFLEFYQRALTPEDEYTVDDLMVKVHRDILETVHACKQDPSYRSLLFDLTDLQQVLATGQELMFSLSAAPASELVEFYCGEKANDVSELPVPQGASFWQENQTMLADIVIRRQQAERVFKFL